jgi:AAA domain
MIKVLTADERLAEGARKVSMVIAGRAKVGKTSLLLTLPEDEVIVLDFEAGLAAVEGRWRGDSIALRTWPDTIDIVCLLGGPDPAKAPDQAFSQAHYDHVVSVAGGIEVARYRIIFVDSITDKTRVAMGWAKTQPDAFSPRTGRPDTRGTYGLLGREVIAALKHLQHAPGKNVIFVGGLDRRTDELGRETFELQTEGAKVGAELPYITDQIITMSDFDYDADAGVWSHNLGKGATRALCCRSPNPWALPAGDRSGRLDLIEQPDLGRLIAKITGTSKP